MRECDPPYGGQGCFALFRAGLFQDAYKGGGNTGYQIAYRLKGKKWKTKNTSNTILTIKKLKRKKTYSVRVRSYKKVKGKVYYGKWSKIMKIKTL